MANIKIFNNDPVSFSNDVGIGTTSPSSLLDISGNSNSSDNIVELINTKYSSTDTAGETGILFGWSNHVAARITAFKEGTVNRTGFKIIGEAGFNIPTTIATFRSTGNVGIGTTDPSVKFHNVGSSIIANNTTIDPDAYTNTIVAGAIADGSGWAVTTAIGGNSGTGDTWAIGHNGNQLYFGMGNGSSTNSIQTYMQFNTDRNLYLVPTSGNVGIGTTSPSNKLDISGAVKIDTDGTYGGSYGTIGFGGTTNGYNRIFGRTSTDDGLFLASATGRGIFFRANGGGTSHMAVASDGKVGIGTESPGYKLDVDGGSTTTPVTHIETTNTGNSVLLSLDSSSGFASGGGTRMRFGRATQGANSVEIGYNHDTAGFEITRNGSSLLGIGSDGLMTHGLEKHCAVSISNSYVRVFYASATSSQLATSVRLTGVTHGSSHVSNFTADILANHSGDITIKSFSGAYTQVTLKAESDGNGNYTLSVKSASANASTYYFRIQALSNRVSISTLPSTTPSTSTTHEHSTNFGTNVTGTGGTLQSNFGGSVTISDDLFVNDFARIDALRVGTTSTDPGDGNLYVEGETTSTKATIGNIKIGAYTETANYAQGISSDTSYLLLQRDQAIPIQLWGSVIESRKNHYFGGSSSTAPTSISTDGTVTVGNGTTNSRVIVDKADNNVSDHLIFEVGGTRIGEIGGEDTTWLRINQETAKNIYTPRYMRADGGFFVDSTSYGIDGNGRLLSNSLSGTYSNNLTFSGTATFLTNTYWQVSAADAALQRADARDDATNYSRLHWYGWTDTGATSNFRHAWYDGANYINVTANASGRIDFAGSAATMYIGSDRVFDDGYHPNADTWTTPRTLTIGDTGKTVNGSGNVSWSTSEIGITKTNIDALNIDAATLDGIAASSFLRSNADDSTSGHINFTTDGQSNGINFTGGSADLQIYRNGNSLNFNVDGSGQVELAINNDEVQIDAPTLDINSSTITVANNIQMASGKGIDFGATANASGISGYAPTDISEVLDDYEEGFWKPIFVSNGIASITNQDVVTGTYVKIGRAVHINAYLRSDGITKNGLTTSAVYIQNLPFSPDDGEFFSIEVGFVGSWLGDHPDGAYIQGTEGRISLVHRNTADGASVTVNAADLGTGTDSNKIIFSGTYFTD